MTKISLILPVLAAGALIAGCGGGGYGDQPAARPADASAAGTAAKGVAKIVEMTDSTFAPATVDVKVGDTVTFVNQDEIAHTATGDNRTFDSETMKAGAKFKFVAEKPGVFSYVCSFHPGMTGKIDVT